MSKYKNVIEKITVTDARFKQSTECVIEPSWINFFYGNNVYRQIHYIELRNSAVHGLS